MPAHTLKLGLIGAGRIGRLHAEHLTSRIPAADLLIVADVFEEAARQCADHYAIPSFTQDYRAVLDHPDIQAVIIWAIWLEFYPSMLQLRRCACLYSCLRMPA